MNNQDVLILSVTPYDFDDQKTGRNVKGLTLWLLPLVSNDKYTNGIKPAKYSLQIEMNECFEDVKLPAFAQMSFDFDFSRNKVFPNNFSNFVSSALADLNG